MNRIGVVAVVLIVLMAIVGVGVNALDITLSKAEDNRNEIIEAYNNWGEPLLDDYDVINVKIISNKIVIRRYHILLEDQGVISSINNGNVQADFTVEVPISLVKEWLIGPKQDWEEDYDKLQFDPISVKYDLKQKCQSILNTEEIE